MHRGLERGKPLGKLVYRGADRLEEGTVLRRALRGATGAAHFAAAARPTGAPAAARPSLSMGAWDAARRAIRRRFSTEADPRMSPSDAKAVTAHSSSWFKVPGIMQRRGSEV